MAIKYVVLFMFLRQFCCIVQIRSVLKDQRAAGKTKKHTMVWVTNLLQKPDCTNLTIHDRALLQDVPVCYSPVI